MPSAKRKDNNGALAALVAESNSLTQNAATAVSRLDRPKKQQGNNTANTTAGQTTVWAGDESATQLGSQQDNKAGGRATRQPGKQQVISLDGSISHTVSSPFNPKTVFPPIDFSLKPIELTDNQFKVLHYIYFSRPYSVASRNGKSEMQMFLGLAYGTLRGNIQALNRKGYIEKPYQVNIGNLKGQTCRVNIDLCLKLFGPSGISEPQKDRSRYYPHDIDNHSQIESVTRQPVKQQDNKATGQLDRQQEPSIEDSLLKNLTTNKDQFIAHFNSTPSLKYWIDKGIIQKNLTDWAGLCNCGIQTLLRYMDYCRFEMVDLGREDKRTETLSPIESVLNYFFMTIKRLGYYRKPKGYISFEEKQAAKAAMALTDLKNETERLEKITNEIWEQERKKDFMKIFSSPSSKVYKKCYAMLNDYQKGRERKNFKSFKNFMFTKYLELISEETK